MLKCWTFPFWITLCSAQLVTYCARLRVQGNCTASPPAGNSSRPLAQLHPGQCVLTTDASLLTWLEYSAPKHVWLHNLYLYAPGEASNDTRSLLYWAPPDQRLSRLYITHVTIQGGQWAFNSNGTVLMEGKHHNSLRWLWTPGHTTRACKL
jgi:hypothetical protein